MKRKIILISTLLLVSLMGLLLVIGRDRDEGEGSKTGIQQDLNIENVKNGGDIEGNQEDKEYMITTFPIRTKIDIVRKEVKIKWKKDARDTKYVIFRSKRQKSGEWKLWEEIATVSGNKESYIEKINLNEEYRYQINVYRNVNGYERFCGPVNGAELCYATTKVAPVVWANDFECENDNTLDILDLMFSYRHGRSGYIVPSGFEIYRGDTKSNLKRIGSINAVFDDDEIQTYIDKKAKRGKAYYYRIRGYAEINGKKEYGKFSPVAQLSTDNSIGKFKATVLDNEKAEIGYLEIKLTSQVGNAPLKLGRKFHRKSKETELIVFTFDGELVSDSGVLGLDKISYRYNQSEKWKELLNETITLKPDKTIYLKISRLDYQKFLNPMETSDYLNLNMCSYNGRILYLQIPLNTEQMAYTRLEVIL